MDLQLVDIQKIPIKSKWPHEEYDFTPWLVENIPKLGGLDCRKVRRRTFAGH